jgi:hypothetical protein
MRDGGSEDDECDAGEEPEEHPDDGEDEDEEEGEVTGNRLMNTASKLGPHTQTDRGTNGGQM